MKSIIDFIEQRSMLSHSENITEKQNFLIKGHTKTQIKKITDDDFYRCIQLYIGTDYKGIMRLLDECYIRWWHKIDDKDLESNKYEAADEGEYYKDLFELSKINDTFYNAYYNTLNNMGGSQSEKESNINMISWLYIQEQRKK